ncbi:hypothetical protein EDB83DRAFT_2675019 [Lactarius deliciosus]|nr:hypothetical protein EDB83DRAFT_2675019 [Lactarius deliciosus]
MSIVRPGTPAQNEAVSDETLHFNFPGSDVVLRSCDAHNFRVLKLYIANISPIFRELFTNAPSPSDTTHGEESLPVVELPEGGAIVFNLLTFIFPVAPILPSTTEKVMELLSVAQKYQMDLVLAHIRGAISRRDPPFIRPETAFHDYVLAQKHELHQEALQAARVTLRLSLTIEGLEDKLEFMPGAYLRELWKYRERVRTELKSSLLEFRNSGLPDDVKSLRCADARPSSHLFPRWLDDYIESLAEALHLFDLIEFENIRARHIKDESRRSTCPCAGISSQAIRAFWEALTTVVHGTIERANSTLALVREEPTSENLDPPFEPLCLNLPDASLIVRSSDQVNFRVHKSLLAVSSPFFEDLLSLPQPPDDELIDGLPVIQLSENAGLLNSLISLLYPIAPAIPSSYEKVFALLAACQKYDMESVQSNIRAEIKRGRFPAPAGAESFRAYAIASSMELIPEMESTARLTLDYPMTFESLGEQLRSLKGWELCNLVRYRRRCRDNLVSCLDAFFDVHSRCQIWASCREWTSWSTPGTTPTSWLRSFFTSKTAELTKGFTHAVFSPSTILEGFMVALKNHTHSGCNACARVHMEGQTFYRELEDVLAQVLDKVNTSSATELDSL